MLLFILPKVDIPQHWRLNITRNKGNNKKIKNGEIISLEQLYKMLHISKRKAAWMLQNSIIPCEIRNTPTHHMPRGKERARFKEMLENLLSAVPDTLTVDEVAELTGYHRRTILRYVQRKYIYAVAIMGKYYISKQSIINYLATDKAFKSTQKSRWHESMILKFQVKNN